jgi:hypothetical protein
MKTFQDTCPACFEPIESVEQESPWLWLVFALCVVGGIAGSAAFAS